MVRIWRDNYATTQDLTIDDDIVGQNVVRHTGSRQISSGSSQKGRIPS